jgi:hypothetical protein
MRGAHPQSGQAAVETALTMPLALFMLLGTIQLFLMLQARTMAQYAVYKATRAGSISNGDCDAMKQAAIATLLPAIAQTNTPTSFATAYILRANNQYFVDSHVGQIVEIYRESPTPGDVPNPEDPEFDSPGHLMRLEVRMVYWYFMKIPFANWIMSSMYLAQYGLQNYTASNPLEPAQADAAWTGSSSFISETWPGGNLGSNMQAWAAMGHYLFPIRVTFTMRMMTPAKQKFFSASGCPL